MADIKNTFGTGLVSHYKLDEASGTRVDAHGTNDLADNNTVGQGTGVQGSCADFESTNSEYLNNTNPTGLTDNNTYSVSFWYKPESTGTQGIVGHTTANDNNVQFQFFLIASKIYFRRNKSPGGGGTIIDVISTTTLSAGTWYHVLGTFSTTNGMVLYIDGTSEATSSDLTATIADATRDIFIGARYRSPADIYTDGLVDEVSFWSGTELTSGNALTIYNSGSGIPYDEGGAETFTPKTVMF